MMKRMMNTAAAMMAVVGMMVGSDLTVQAHTLDDSAFVPVEGTMMSVSAGASENVGVHLAEYQSIPENILVRLTADHCRIYIDTFEEEGGYLDREIDPNSRAVGVFSGSVHAGYKSVGRKNWAVIEANYIDVLSGEGAESNTTLYHEVGHYVDDSAFGGWSEHGEYGIASSTERWQALYAANAAVIGGLSRGSAVNVYSACECFATSFAWYIHDPQTLLNASPEVYAYIEEVVASI